MGNIRSSHVLDSKFVLHRIVYTFRQRHEEGLEDTHIFDYYSRRQMFLYKIGIFFWSSPKTNHLYRQHNERYCSMGILLGIHTSLRKLHKSDFQGMPNIAENFISSECLQGKPSIVLLDIKELMQDNTNIFHSPHSRLGNFHKQYICHLRCEECFKDRRTCENSIHRQKFQGKIYRLLVRHPRTITQHIERI